MNSRFATPGALALLLLLAAAGAPSAHAGARLGPLNVSRTSGTTLEIPLGFTSTEAVTCAQFDILYDPARLTLGNSTTSTSAPGHTLLAHEVSSGRRRIVLYSTELEPLAGGYIVRVPVTFVSTGDSALALDDVTLASPAPGAVAYSGGTLAPVIASSGGSAGPTGGSAASMSVESLHGSGVTYQWKFNGTAIAGATSATLAFPSAQPFHAGAYTVVVAANGLVLDSASFDFAVNAPPASDARVLNLSTRALDLTGNDVLIPGFVIRGTGTKRMLVRGVGPGLFDVFGLTGTLADPQLSLRDQATGAEVAANDDWGTSPDKASIIATSAAVGAFSLLDGSKDAVIVVDLPAGVYTAPTVGAGGGTGIALVELYDADAAAGSGSPPSPGTAQLVNISNRGFVDVGDKIMIPGFVVSPEGPRTFLIRAVGPGLTNSFGLTGVLADPVLTIFRGPDAILTNDDWSTAPGAASTASTAAAVGAFSLVSGSADAAFVVTLAPGAYTVQATGKSSPGSDPATGATGVALVEIYLVP